MGTIIIVSVVVFGLIAITKMICDTIKAKYNKHKHR